MKFSIHSDIFNRFPGLILGIVVVSRINNRGQNEKLQRKIQEKEEEIQKNFLSETLSRHPNIQAWRRAYSAFGAKPKKYKSSVENLYRMVLKGIKLRSINTLVDSYNYVSLKHMIPVGGDDLDQVDGDISLCVARGNEPFTPLNSLETERVKAGEIIYTDAKEVLCRRWNWRECNKTKMTLETISAALVLEGLPPVGREDVHSAAEDLSALVREFCGGESQIFFLDINQPKRELLSVL